MGSSLKSLGPLFVHGVGRRAVGEAERSTTSTVPPRVSAESSAPLLHGARRRPPALASGDAEHAFGGDERARRRPADRLRGARRACCGVADALRRDECVPHDNEGVVLVTSASVGPTGTRAVTRRTGLPATSTGARATRTSSSETSARRATRSTRSVETNAPAAARRTDSAAPSARAAAWRMRSGPTSASPTTRKASSLVTRTSAASGGCPARPEGRTRACDGRASPTAAPPPHEGARRAGLVAPRQDEGMPDRWKSIVTFLGESRRVTGPLRLRRQRTARCPARRVSCVSNRHPRRETESLVCRDITTKARMQDVDGCRSSPVGSSSTHRPPRRSYSRARG